MNQTTDIEKMQAAIRAISEGLVDPLMRQRDAMERVGAVFAVAYADAFERQRVRDAEIMAAIRSSLPA